MQQMEVKSSALLLSHTWPALPHVRREEADTRLLLHVADAVKKGCKKVTIRAVDTDVVVLAVASFSKTTPDELWVAFGVGSGFRYIAVHEMVATLNPTQCPTLPVFQSFTLSPSVILYLHSLVEERRLPVKLGSLSQR